MANETKQAEKWEDYKPHARRFRRCLEAIPSPPRPDDSYADKINAITRAVEGFEEFVESRSQQED